MTEAIVISLVICAFLIFWRPHKESSRESLVKLIQSRPSSSVIVIHGVPGIGKSWLLDRLDAQQVSIPLSSPFFVHSDVVAVDNSDYMTEEDVRVFLTSGARCIFACRNPHHVEEMIQRVRASKKIDLSVVETYRLDGLEKPTATRFILSQKKMSRLAVEFVWRQTGGHPQLLISYIATAPQNARLKDVKNVLPAVKRQVNVVKQRVDRHLHSSSETLHELGYVYADETPRYPLLNGEQ